MLFTPPLTPRSYTSMRIIHTNAGLITNFEVSKTLEAQKARNKQLKRATKDMIFVEKQVGHYLHHHSLVRRQTDDSVQAFLESSAEFKLTMAEQLQIVNLCPTTLVEIYLSVDDIETRIGAEGAARLLEVVLSTLYVEEPEKPVKAVVAPLLKERTSGKKHGFKHGSQRGGRGRGRGGRGGGRGDAGGKH